MRIPAYCAALVSDREASGLEPLKIATRSIDEPPVIRPIFYRHKRWRQAARALVISGDQRGRTPSAGVAASLARDRRDGRRRLGCLRRRATRSAMSVSHTDRKHVLVQHLLLQLLLRLLLRYLLSLRLLLKYLLLMR